jgi:uncharacterized repeat protein (TIGR03803 family)
LIDVGGTLYGTTLGGGSLGLGSVFALTTSGADSLVCSWSSNNAGAGPEAGLTDVNGTLYGTTEGGGSEPAGTVFSTPL